MKKHENEKRNESFWKIFWLIWSTCFPNGGTKALYFFSGIFATCCRLSIRFSMEGRIKETLSSNREVSFFVGHLGTQVHWGFPEKEQNKSFLLSIGSKTKSFRVRFWSKDSRQLLRRSFCWNFKNCSKTVAVLRWNQTVHQQQENWDEIFKEEGKSMVMISHEWEYRQSQSYELAVFLAISIP